ncbi:aldo/keto reductase [Bimuria novae-zelandiae CBS 107.79]|uniref:Aldo/keto reductase n=1 Tax=Bimuria novae-zelandiae CBS 107.79 TaxID=1447943 RepID=A0A6A5UNQ7_9PLEO|nr:aldo/keto reductase [Bimuria novae-zelandiae CBS 107.79]
MPTIVGKEVGPIGLGLMGLTRRANPISTDDGIQVLKTALDNGVNLWNGADFYGPPDNNSLTLLEKYFAKYPEDADKVVISIKGAAGPQDMTPDGSPDAVRASVDNCIKLLNGRKKIDLFQPDRIDPKTPLEVTLGVLDKEYVQTGKIGGIGLSEVKAATIREAAKYTKVASLRASLNVGKTDIFENGVAAATAELRIPLVAYSPMGRGFLTGQFKTLDDVPQNSLLRHFPRFQLDTFPINIQFAEQVAETAKRKGVSPAQFTLGWTIAKGNGSPVVIPIPGATTSERVVENSKKVDLTEAELAELDETLKKFETVGDRYPDFIPIEG